MNEYKMEMTITCATGDADHFYNTVLMIAKGFEIGVLASRLGPIGPENIIQPVPELSPKEGSKKNLSIKEAAEYLNISKGTLYRHTSEATIPYYKIGSRILFKIEELDTWLNERKVQRYV